MTRKNSTGTVVQDTTGTKAKATPYTTVVEAGRRWATTEGETPAARAYDAVAAAFIEATKAGTLLGLLPEIDVIAAGTTGLEAAAGHALSQSVDLTQVEEPAARDLLWDFSRMRTDSEEAAWAGALLADGPSPDGVNDGDPAHQPFQAGLLDGGMMGAAATPGSGAKSGGVAKKRRRRATATANKCAKH
ncbi:TPA: hypothetical protein ACH3X2_002540 [Trebouxia sp. C0005]